MNDSITIDGTNPNTLWARFAWFFITQGKNMQQIYKKRMNSNNPITWGELDDMNKTVHETLDKLMAESEIVYENKIMKKNKNVMRLTEAQLHQVIKESVEKILRESELNELDPRTYASYAQKRAAQGQMDKAQSGRQAAANAWNKQYGRNDEYQNGWVDSETGAKGYNTTIQRMNPQDYSVETWKSSSHPQIGGNNFDSEQYMRYDAQKDPSSTYDNGFTGTEYSGKGMYGKTMATRGNYMLNTPTDSKSPYNDYNTNKKQINYGINDQEHKVAHQMARGNGQYIKGQGWQ